MHKLVCAKKCKKQYILEVSERGLSNKALGGVDETSIVQPRYIT